MPALLGFVALYPTYILPVLFRNAKPNNDRIRNRAAKVPFRSDWTFDVRCSLVSFIDQTGLSLVRGPALVNLIYVYMVNRVNRGCKPLPQSQKADRSQTSFFLDQTERLRPAAALIRKLLRPCADFNTFCIKFYR
jgi:hypothetical protein